jgi:putative DNA primase/helicase
MFANLFILVEGEKRMHIANTVSIYANTFVTAKKFQDRGWSVTPVKFQTKQPILQSWQTGGADKGAFNEHFSSGPINVGIVLGEASNGLVDVDLDDPVALKFADDFLPATNCVFGRASNPSSHRIYQVRSPKNVVAFVGDGETILEIRGNKHLTVFPGSVHTSGEPIEFEKGCDGDPGLTEWAELESAARRIAVATLLFKSWTPGSRHKIALSASGFLQKLGWSETDVHQVIKAIVTYAMDGEPFDRLDCVKTTYAKPGEPISGKRELIDLVGEKAVSAIEKWCRSREVRNASGSASDSAAALIAASDDITTDSGASDAFANAKRGQLIFRDDTETWFKKDRQVFRPISYVQIQGEAKRFMQEQVCSAGILGSTRSLLSKGKIDNLLTLSRHHFRVEPELLDQSRHLVGCSDGTILDLDTQKIACSPTGIITKTLRCYFEPDAQCPRFEVFLNQIFDGNESVIAFLNRAVGYSISGYNFEQCLFLLVGHGANGKSTLLNVLQHVLGDYAATTPTQTLMVSRHGNEQTNDLAKLVGIRFVAATESEKGQRLAESKIKRITGGDRVVCRELYGNLFEYDPHFKIWLATNDLPQFSGGDKSIARRMWVIEFPVTFDEAEQDHSLQDRLLDEAPGILNWMLKGHAEWKRQGLNPPEVVRITTTSYRTENDSVGQFIDARCCLDPNGRETTGELYVSYESWCRVSGMEPMPKNSFGKELKRRGYESVKLRQGNGWRGLRLQEQEQDLDPSALFGSTN